MLLTLAVAEDDKIFASEENDGELEIAEAQFGMPGMGMGMGMGMNPMMNPMMMNPMMMNPMMMNPMQQYSNFNQQGYPTNFSNLSKLF